MPPEPPPKPADPLARERKGGVFSRRLLSTVGLWGLVAVAAWFANGIVVLVLLGAVALVALREYLAMLGDVLDAPARRVVLGLSALYVFVSSAWIYRSGERGEEPGFAVEMGGIYLVIVSLFAVEMRRALRGHATLAAITAGLFGFVYIPVLFSFVARVAFYRGVGDGGTVAAIPLVLYVIAVTKFTDMGAYLVGTMIGKHKMIPHISPGKTWEGFAGALFFAQLAACGLFACFPEALSVLNGYVHVIALGVILALLAVIGDLAESVVKRSLGAKDSGRFLPGIGGSLDLIDSVCFTAPALFLYLQWIG